MRLSKALEAIDSRKEELPLTERELAVLRETVEHYYRNPRSAKEGANGSCYYEHPNTGAACAVGRCMTVAKRKELVKEGKNEAVVREIRVGYYLKQRYKGLSDRFWGFLQELHDRACFWNGPGARGLTDKGLEFIINASRWQ